MAPRIRIRRRCREASWRRGCRCRRASLFLSIWGMLLVLQVIADRSVNYSGNDGVSAHDIVGDTADATQCLSTTAGVCTSSDGEGDEGPLADHDNHGNGSDGIDNDEDDEDEDGYSEFLTYFTSESNSSQCANRMDLDQCTTWLEEGECEANPRYMLYHCSATCGICTIHTRAGDWGVKQLLFIPPPMTVNITGADGNDMKAKGEEEDENGGMRKNHIRMDKEDGLHLEIQSLIDTLDVLRRTHQYMNAIRQKSLDEYSTEDEEPIIIYTTDVLSRCQNKNEECSLWAAKGYCTHYEDHLYMIDHCAPACQFCHLLAPWIRCPEHPTPDLNVDGYGNFGDEKEHVPSISHGSWDPMFERIIDPQEEFDMLYNVTVLSRPQAEEQEEEDGEEEHKHPLPWIIALDNFLSLEECEHLIALGEGAGYGVSSEYSNEPDENGEYGTVYSKGRTSTNTWQDPRSDEVAMSIMDRMTDLTGLTGEYSEDFQLLKYTESQRYEEHHDYTVAQLYTGAGARVLTFFLYLNDVEEGGGTEFTQMTSWDDVTQQFKPFVVTPKAGRALIWTNVLDVDDESESFPLHEFTWHEALPVTKGLKYGANVWFHMHKFKMYSDRGCEQ